MVLLALVVPVRMAVVAVAVAGAVPVELAVASQEDLVMLKLDVNGSR